MSNAYEDCEAAVAAAFAAGWSRAEPVLWHRNAGDGVPDPAADPFWLHAAVEFGGERLEAFGGGRGANEVSLRGGLVLRAFAERGRGEARVFAMLGDAVAAVRSVRVGDLTFGVGDALPGRGASVDGLWWYRAARVGFLYRFRG